MRHPQESTLSADELFAGLAKTIGGAPRRWPDVRVEPVEHAIDVVFEDDDVLDDSDILDVEELVALSDPDVEVIDPKDALPTVPLVIVRSEPVPPPPHRARVRVEPPPRPQRVTTRMSPWLSAQPLPVAPLPPPRRSARSGYAIADGEDASRWPLWMCALVAVAAAMCSFLTSPLQPRSVDRAVRNIRAQLVFGDAGVAPAVRPAAQPRSLRRQGDDRS